MSAPQSARAYWLLALLSACGPSPLEAVDVTSPRLVAADTLQLSGSYWSPRLGTLVLTQTGSALDGSYWAEAPEDVVVGALTGRVCGNRAQASFSETWTVNGQARNYLSEGSFVYSSGRGTPAMLVGQQTYFVETQRARGGIGKEARHTVLWTALRLESPRSTSDLSVSAASSAFVPRLTQP